MKFVRIPKERVGVLIGKDGETKKTIERISQMHLEIDSEEGDVSFNEQEAKDPLVPLKVEDVINESSKVSPVQFSPSMVIPWQ
ncbi:MAG: universal archaeal domain protein [Thermoplasmatales archaeon]|nr:universal archaeal domain protein [Thermoplasmatales archaeon]